MVRAIDLRRTTTPTSCLQSIVVDHSADGGQFAYVSDAGQGAVIVYNVGRDRSFKVHVPAGSCGRRDVMYVALAQVDAMDGDDAVHHRRLYVTYLSSCDMMYVPLHTVDDATDGLSTVNVGRKPYKMIVLGTDRESVVYFRADDSNDIWSWDVNKLFRRQNFRWPSPRSVASLFLLTDIYKQDSNCEKIREEMGWEKIAKKKFQFHR